MNATRPLLQIQELKTQFFTPDGIVTAINDLSLDIHEGEIVGVVGESGSGKSTLALSIMRLLPAAGKITGGRILLQDRNLAGLAEGEMNTIRGRKIAMVFQDSLAALDPTMRIGRQIAEALELQLKLPAQKARDRAIELLELVGIPGAAQRLNDYPHQFSGGMRQRVMIAIALSCDPALIIADEPTTALDVTVQRQILELLMRLRDRIGVAVILITHDVGVVAQMCDRVIVMYAGQKVESGLTESVFRAPKHPYTVGLLSSSLELEHDRQQRLKAIPGLPPDLTDLPGGCPFAPRCARRLDRCETITPVLELVDIDHEAACWNIEGSEHEQRR